MKVLPKKEGLIKRKELLKKEKECVVNTMEKHSIQGHVVVATTTKMMVKKPMWIEVIVVV